MMKALILTCNTGEGHNSTSAAVSEVFHAHGCVCDAVDALGFLSPIVSKTVCKGHAQVYRYMPKAFDAGYRAAEKHPDALNKRSLMFHLLGMGKHRLYRHITEGEYDTLICPHAFSAMMVTAMTERYPELKLRTAFIATDYTCSPSVSTSNMDIFFIPDEALREDFIAKGVPADRICPSGIPVRSEFCQHGSREEADRLCERPPHGKHLLLMCGSMGCGPMEDLVRIFAGKLQEDDLLTVICGTNQLLYNRMAKEFGDHPNIHVRGFVHNVPVLMDTADVYITKPGGLSVTEAAVKVLPMVFVDAVAGCEEYNLRFFRERGMAATGDSDEGIVDVCLRLMRDNDALEKMRTAQTAFHHIDAGERIYRALEADVKNG